MSGSSSNQDRLLDLPLDLFTAVCQQLDLRDLVRVSATCTRFRHGGTGLEMAELPNKSPVVTVLREHAFPGGQLVPSTRPIGCSEPWVTYLARCARQRRCREAPPLAAGLWHSMFLDAAGRVLACGRFAAVGHGDAGIFRDPFPVSTLAGVRMRAVAAGVEHSLALTWDGRVFSWGDNSYGELGREGTRDKPALVEGLVGVRDIAAGEACSLAVTQSGEVFRWGKLFHHGALRPISITGFGGVRVRRVFAGPSAFAIGEDGELFSWGDGYCGRLGHGNTQDQPSPKRVEALRGLRVRSVSVGWSHALALAEDGLVYAWGENEDRALLGNPNVERQLLPTPVEALQGVRVSSVAVARWRSYAVTETGEVWAWGCDSYKHTAIGHGEKRDCPLPELIESLRGVKVDAVAAGERFTLALADDGSVYSWGDDQAAGWGALGRGPSSDGCMEVHTPQLIPALRVACGL